ncbi:Uncharacterised protein [Phocoenobacter uteri]|uniref:Conjugal transfer protein TraD n=1 Tax=Phocoenobacter uteri TaxID=146806 RepID=A0A379DEH3_9PAST|nr:hypothetical protein [Phocoenobacter uteri]MDG6882825.1 hypothetical protein [Phocoenobacter uteri]SUB76388.1 Uncharacterised protein [Phocoenobacter uteri]
MPNLIDELIGSDNEQSIIETEALESKMIEANNPGAIIEFSPEEADYLGAFEDDSMDMEDIIEGALDLLNSN